MLILLPPSEGKRVPTRGKPLDLATLSRPELTDARRTVLDALIDISGRDDATAALKVSAGLADVVRANTALRSAPTAAAERIYSGVLYDALEAAGLDAAARRRMARRVVIYSALFGVLRTSDRIPAYRLSGGVSLPGIGPLPRFWRSNLDESLTAKGLVIDCRSASYAAMWTPPTGQHLAVRVFREAEGVRTVVSHMAKHSRGLIARALCEEASEPRNAGELAELLNAWFGAHEVHTATGVPVTVYVEASDGAIDVITR